MHYYNENPDEKKAGGWGNTRSQFLDWWLLSRISIHPGALQIVALKYTLGTMRAFQVYFLSGDIIQAYDALNDDLHEYGFENPKRESKI